MSKASYTTPMWLDKEFLQKALQNRENGTCKTFIATYDVSLATDPGDNYISELYRVRIETSDGNKRTVIVKCLPSAEFNLKFIRDACLFDKEILFYRSTLPEMRSLYMDSDFDLTPKCLYIHSDSAIVLEDLVPLGYQVANRRKGLNLEQCSWAVQALARFHALSIGLSASELSSSYRDTVYSGTSEAHAVSYITNSILSLAATVEKWSGCERFGAKLRRIAPLANDRVLQLFESESPILVLNHGDFWTNNIMFQYKGNRVSGIKIIDFQMCRYVSPALDLLYFFYTSPEECVRLHNLEKLLMVYYTELCKCIRPSDKVETFTFDQLKEEMNNNAFFGFLSACLMLPAVLADPEELPDFANIADDNSTIICHSGNLFCSQFQRILQEFEEKGVI